MSAPARDVVSTLLRIGEDQRGQKDITVATRKIAHALVALHILGATETPLVTAQEGTTTPEEACAALLAQGIEDACYWLRYGGDK